MAGGPQFASSPVPTSEYSVMSHVPCNVRFVDLVNTNGTMDLVSNYHCYTEHFFTLQNYAVVNEKSGSTFGEMRPKHSSDTGISASREDVVPNLCRSRSSTPAPALLLLLPLPLHLLLPLLLPLLLLLPLFVWESAIPTPDSNIHKPAP